jgi:periplasmic divalent cation tolerance protein
VRLLLTTPPELAEQAEAEIRRLHPYDCPPILRIAMEANADFLDWIRAETSG